MDFDNYLRGTNEELHNYNEFINQTLRQGLSNDGWTVPALSSAQISTVAALLTSTGLPYLPAGALWYDTTLKKLRFLADRGTSPAWTPTIETVTSV